MNNTSNARVPRIGEPARLLLSQSKGNRNNRMRRKRGDGESRNFKLEGTCQKKKQHLPQADQEICPLINFKKLLRQINSSNPRMRCKGIKIIRSILSTGNNPPIDDFIEAGFVKVLVNCLKDDVFPKIQFDAIWALTNISSGTAEQTKYVVDAGILPHFSRLLSRPLIKANYEILEQIVWCIGNILGDGHELRNTLIEKGIADRIVNIIVHNSKELPISCIRNLSWAISNLTRNKEVPVDLDVVVKWLPAFHILLDYEDVTAKIDAIWGISYLLDSGDSEIQMIMESGFFPVILPLLEHSDSSIRNAALRSVGTILSGADPHTQEMLDLNVLSYLKRLMNSPNQDIRKEATWCISNICAGNPMQISMAQEAGFFPKIIEHLSQSYKIQKEAVWCIISLASNGSTNQVHQIILDGALQPFCRLLNTNDLKLLDGVLTGIYKLLKNHDTKDFMIATMIEECGGMLRLEQLQSHENVEIYRKSYKILDTFFSTAEFDSTTELDDDYLYNCELSESQFNLLKF